MMSELPTTAAVISAIGKDGVIVGSWPVKGDKAKDLDVVIKGRGQESHNPTIERLRKFAFISSIVGHLFIDATPIAVEIFEDKGWPVDDETKRDGMLTYAAAKRRSVWVECHGTAMRAVKS